MLKASAYFDTTLLYLLIRLRESERARLLNRLGRTLKHYLVSTHRGSSFSRLLLSAFGFYFKISQRRIQYQLERVRLCTGRTSGAMSSPIVLREDGFYCPTMRDLAWNLRNHRNVLHANHSIKTIYGSLWAISLPRKKDYCLCQSQYLVSLQAIEEMITV